MRKALIAVIAAAVLFAVGAFAASLAVDTENVASGESGVGSCAEFVDVSDWVVPERSGEDGDWSATGATVTLTTYSGASCAGADVRLAIYSDDESGWTESTCEGIDGSSTEYTCDGFSLPVEPISEVAVLVDGDTFDITDPPPSA